MRNFQDTFETCKRSFISVFPICMTVRFNNIYERALRLVNNDHEKSLNSIVTKNNLKIFIKKS